jgi:hypothetical protein
MNVYDVIVPLGIGSYVILGFAVLTGLRIIKVKVKVHKVIALIGITGATLHAGFVIYFNYF